MATLTQELAKFVCHLKYEDIPQPVVEKIKTCILHAICMGLAGYDLEAVKIAKRVISANPSPAQATIIGDRQKVSVLDAAFVNSTMFLNRVQGDTHGVTHTGSLSIPLALALAENEGKSGKELLTAVTAAYEVMGLLGKDFTKLSSQRGFRASSIYGILGTTTVAGLLFNLTEEQMAHALGFAAGVAGGTAESLAQGTMEWRFQEGFAARNGVLAALLAKEGAVAAPTALEAFYKAFAGTTENLDQITQNMGTQWETMNVLFKLYPTCIQNNTNVVNAISLAEEKNIAPRKIKSVYVEMNEFEANYPGHKYMGPFETQSQTLNSVAFCVSNALLFRRLTYNDLLKFDDPEILAMVKRVQVEGKPDVNLLCSRITVEMEDGTKHFRKMDVTEKFYSLDFQTDVDMIRKMADEIPISAEQLNGLVKTVAKLETLDGVEKIIKLTEIKSESRS